MKINTSDLTGPALDWAVARCEGVNTTFYGRGLWYGVEANDYRWEWHPSSNWSQGGPIIEREGINLDNYGKNPRWSAWTPAPDRESGEAQAYGPTPLIAAMRCFVASKLGDEVNIPEELCN